MLADGEDRLRDFRILQVGVGNVHRVAGEVDLQAVVEPFERRAFEPEARAAQCGAIVVIVAALPLMEHSSVGLDHPARLEREVAVGVGHGRRPAELRGLGCPVFDRLDAPLVQLGLLLKLGVARLQLLHSRLQRIEAVEDRVTCRLGRGLAGPIVGRHERVERRLRWRRMFRRLRQNW